MAYWGVNLIFYVIWKNNTPHGSYGSKKIKKKESFESIQVVNQVLFQVPRVCQGRKIFQKQRKTEKYDTASGSPDAWLKRPMHVSWGKKIAFCCFFYSEKGKKPSNPMQT